MWSVVTLDAVSKILLKPPAGIIPPDIVPGIAYRGWVVSKHHGVLRSKTESHPYLWRPMRPLTAECDVQSRYHEASAPYDSCSCGIHGRTLFSWLKINIAKETDVLGGMYCWGKQIEDNKPEKYNNIRVEHAYPAFLVIKYLSESLLTQLIPYGVPIFRAAEGHSLHVIEGSLELEYDTQFSCTTAAYSPGFIRKELSEIYGRWRTY